MTKLCDPPGVSATCTPGCDTGSWQDWCTVPTGTLYNCAWRPVDLAYMLELQMGAPYNYNELVVGTQRWLQDPVASIEAFFFSRGAGDQEQKASAVHSSLIAEYGHARSQIPLLSLDLTRGDAPFAVV